MDLGYLHFLDLNRRLLLRSHTFLRFYLRLWHLKGLFFINSGETPSQHLRLGLSQPRKLRFY